MGQDYTGNVIARKASIPFCLAMYMAKSACFTNSLAFASPFSLKEIPILVVTFISLSFTKKGESNDTNILLATLITSSSSLLTSGNSIVNSSPANLDKVAYS